MVSPPGVPRKAFTNKPNGHAAAPPKMAEEIAEKPWRRLDHKFLKLQ